MKKVLSRIPIPRSRLLVCFFCIETGEWIPETSMLGANNAKVAKRRTQKRSECFFFRFARVVLSSSSSSFFSSFFNLNLNNSKTPRHSGRCQYVPILGLIGVLLCLAGLAIYAGGAVPAGRTIAALVSKVDTKTATSSSNGEENSASSSSSPSPPRPMGGGPLSRLVGAYIATTAVSQFRLDFF